MVGHEGLPRGAPERVLTLSTRTSVAAFLCCVALLEFDSTTHKQQSIAQNTDQHPLGPEPHWVEKGDLRDWWDPSGQRADPSISLEHGQ